MKKYFSKTIIISFSMLVLLFASCTNVDKTLGVDMVPDNELFVLVTDTLYPPVYNVTLDSVMTINITHNSFGSYFDPIFGTTTAGFSFQMMPAYDSVDFGTTHMVDSVVLYMIIDSRTGADDYEQTLKVYELNQTIYYDSVYYPCLDMNTMIDPTPIGTKQYKRTPKDRWDTSDTIKIYLDNSLGDKLIAAPDEVKSLDSLKLFYDYFKGLYITTDEVAPGFEGRMNRMPIGTENLHLILYYKRDGRDTTTLYTHYRSISMAFTTVEHDYTKATHPLKVNATTLNDTTQITSSDSTLYIQGLFGITPMIKIRKDDIQNWLTAQNIAVGEIAIVNATLEFDVERFSGYDFERLVSQIGLFYRALQAYSTDEDARKYPHLSAINELNSTIFGGALNKTLYKYPMKITYDFTTIVKNIEKSNSAIIYAIPYMQLTNSSYYGESYSYVENQTLLYQTLLKGPSSSKPPRLIVTYAKPKY